MASLPLYGFDIETDTSTNGLDPSCSAIVAAALATGEHSYVFDGDERQLLGQLDAAVAQLPAGVIVTWNGAGFDLPFVVDRAHHHGLTLGLDLRLDAAIAGHHDPLAGHDGPYRASWHHHDHLDAYQVFRADVGAALGLSCGLKPMAALVGLTAVEVDRSQIHRLDTATRRAYVASDAELTRALVARRPWASVARATDAHTDHTSRV